VTEFLERRRAARVTLPYGHEIALRISARVQLLDISMTGIFLACSTGLRPEARGALHATLGAQPFAAEVVIRRYQPGSPETTGVRGAGAMFISIDEQTHQRLESFLATKH
jgi:c-di-GMP-binding flagellar brake protein YcgR